MPEYIREKARGNHNLKFLAPPYVDLRGASTDKSKARSNITCRAVPSWPFSRSIFRKSGSSTLDLRQPRGGFAITWSFPAATSQAKTDKRGHRCR